MQSWKVWGDIDNSSKGAMRHVQWTVNENNNMNYVPFPTRIRHLCRLPALLNCSYTWNFITRADGPCLIRADAAAGWYIWYKNRWTETDIIESNRCYTPSRRTLKCTRISHRPLHHNKTIVLCVYMMTTYTSSSLEYWRKRSPPVCLDQRRRHFEIWRRQKRKRRVCRIVVTSQ